MTHSLIDSNKSSTNSDNEASPFVRLLCPELSGPTFLDVVEEIPTAFDAEIYGPGTGWLEKILEDALWQTLGDCNEQAASLMDMLRMRDPDQTGRAITHTLERIYSKYSHWSRFMAVVLIASDLTFQCSSRARKRASGEILATLLRSYRRARCPRIPEIQLRSR